MEASPNKYFWHFSEANRPAMWKSRQARGIYAEAVAAEAEGQHIPEAVPGSVRIVCAPPPDHPEMHPYGTPPAAVETAVLSRAQQLRAQADAMERVLRAYGPAAFIMKPEPVAAPKHPFDAETAILSVLRRPGVQKVFVHGKAFSKDESGAFRLERA